MRKKKRKGLCRCLGFGGFRLGLLESFPHFSVAQDGFVAELDYVLLVRMGETFESYMHC